MRCPLVFSVGLVLVAMACSRDPIEPQAACTVGARQCANDVLQTCLDGVFQSTQDCAATGLVCAILAEGPACVSPGADATNYPPDVPDVESPDVPEDTEADGALADDGAGVPETECDTCVEPSRLTLVGFFGSGAVPGACAGSEAPGPEAPGPGEACSGLMGIPGLAGRWNVSGGSGDPGGSGEAGD